MKIKSILIVVFMILLLLCSFVLWVAPDEMKVRAQEGEDPNLLEPYVYNLETEVVFGISYQDDDNDTGDVLLYLNQEEVQMYTIDTNPLEGQIFEAYRPKSGIDDYDEFYFYAEDVHNGSTFLPINFENPFLVGDFLGWGEDPTLSNLDVYLEDGSYVFEVLYSDPEGHSGIVSIYLYYEINEDEFDEKLLYLEPWDGNPLDGQNFDVYVTGINGSWRFYLEATDENGSYTALYAPGGSHFYVRDFVSTNGGRDKDKGGGGFSLPGIPSGWLDNPEVVVGIIGLAALAGGSAYGVWRKKKKRSRFSDLLTDLDEIYSSYKMNPHKCESELEKMRGVINGDLKRGVIDENNYSILKERIDELMTEIRSDALHTQVAEIPKDIEIRIKDMLIDGEITREEYDKLLPIIKGSDMAADDKEKMEKVVESWVKKDKE